MELLINDLTKQYADKTAIDHVSCRLTPGITGLLGANGAGKSTLMRMVCGVMRPTCGSVELDGYDVMEKEYRNLIGYLPQDFGYYPEFTGTAGFDAPLQLRIPGCMLNITIGESYLCLFLLLMTAPVIWLLASAAFLAAAGAAYRRYQVRGK